MFTKRSEYKISSGLTDTFQNLYIFSYIIIWHKKRNIDFSNINITIIEFQRIFIQIFSKDLTKTITQHHQNISAQIFQSQKHSCTPASQFDSRNQSRARKKAQNTMFLGSHIEGAFKLEMSPIVITLFALATLFSSPVGWGRPSSPAMMDVALRTLRRSSPDRAGVADGDVGYHAKNARIDFGL